jgi:hypothetical protein
MPEVADPGPLVDNPVVGQVRLGGQQAVKAGALLMVKL